MSQSVSGSDDDCRQIEHLTLDATDGNTIIRATTPDDSQITAKKEQISVKAGGDEHLHHAIVGVAQRIQQSARISASVTESKGKHKAIEYRTKFDILDIPAQISAEKWVEESGEVVEHLGVTCDGPLCAGVKEQTSIKGSRFKCAICDQVDFCSKCVVDYNNTHNACHSLVKCVVPTRFSMIRPSDLEGKRQLLDKIGHTSTSSSGLSHVVVAQTGVPCYGKDLAVRPSDIEFPSPTIFVMENSRVDELPKHGANRLIEEPIPDGEYVSGFRINENLTVSVTHEALGETHRRTGREDVIVHHQDTDLLLKVLSGKMRHFDYQLDSKFLIDAKAGRMATRVIDIKPGGFDDKLECNLRCVCVEEAPVYEALSYTWKETAYERANHSTWTQEHDQAYRNFMTMSHAIYCGDSFVKISCGLRDALKRLRDPLQTKSFWIDQISIDQGNTCERAYQVRLMKFIYNRAQRVVVWTGDELEDTAVAIVVLKKLAAVRAMAIELTLSAEDLVGDQALDLPDLESPVWDAVYDLLLRPVFGRSWVIQEIVVGQAVVVRCGGHTVSWEELSSAAYLLAEPTWLRALERVIQSRKEQRNVETHPGAIIMINGLRYDFQHLRENSLENLVYSTGLSAATDPRDKIFAILGIRGARFDPTTTNDAKTDVDYEKPTRDVFVDAAKAIIVAGQSLDICGLNGNAEKVTKGLPSYVPDFASTTNSIAISLSRPQPPGPFHTSGKSEAIAAWPFENQSDILATSSYKAETVIEVAQNFDMNNKNDIHRRRAILVEWTKLASKCGPNYVTGEFVPDVFWRVCVTDSTLRWRQSPAPPSYHAAMVNNFLALICTSLDLMMESQPSTEGNDVFQNTMGGWTNEVLGTLLADAVSLTVSPDQDAVAVYNSVCMNRRFFLTSGGYLGIGPVYTKVGDEVHILSGAKVPFMMRRTKHDEADGESEDTSR
ncbi:hypothetical protein MMC25_007493, partial [Agyrium rufum]|nr:hypothetical protein [Agyrium rufum]